MVLHNSNQYIVSLKCMQVLGSIIYVCNTLICCSLTEAYNQSGYRREGKSSGQFMIYIIVNSRLLKYKEYFRLNKILGYLVQRKIV